MQVLLNRLSSVFSHSSSNIGRRTAYYPCRLDRRIRASIRCRSEALVNPLQALAAEVSLAIMTDRKIVCIAASHIPRAAIIVHVPAIGVACDGCSDRLTVTSNDDVNARMTTVGFIIASSFDSMIASFHTQYSPDILS